MLEKNYTNETDRGRFGFSENGVFRSSFKSEGLLIIIFFAVFVLGTLGGIIGAVSFINYMIANSPDGTKPMFFAIIGAVMVFGSAALSFTVYKVAVSYIKQGFKCTYSATEEVFTANVGGVVSVIKYAEVTAVKFTPTSIGGKIYGYEVEVVLGNKSKKFGLRFSGNFQSEKNTPFYTIAERAELIKNRLTEEAANMKNANFAAIAPVENDRKSSSSEVDEMPAISAVKNLEKSPEKPKLSPTVEGYAAENKRIFKSEQPLTDMDRIKRSRELDEKEIIAQGSFYMGSSETKYDLWFIFVSLLILFNIYIVCSVLIQIDSIFSLPLYGFLLADALLITAVCISLKSGRSYKYSANAREFSFSRKDKKGAVAHFFYKDILSVDYCQHKFLWFDLGYFVAIETKSGFFTYNYNFPRFGHYLETKKLPFETIRERIDPNVNLPEQKSGRLAFSAKKAAVHFAAAAAYLAFGIFSVIKGIHPNYTGVVAVLQYFVLMPVLAAVGIIYFLRKIMKGDEYRCRADDKEFIVRRADGKGKTVRIPLEEITEIAFKQHLFTAAVNIKTKSKTLKFRYMLPVMFKKTELSETPFGVLQEKLTQKG